MSNDLFDFERSLNRYSPFEILGKIQESNGLVYEVSLTNASLGQQVSFETESGESCLGEVVSIKKNTCLVMPYEELLNINCSTKVALLSEIGHVRVSHQLLGRVIDYLGNPIDGKGPIKTKEKMPLTSSPVNPLSRPPIKEAVELGIKSIDGFMTVGKGQRMAILAGSGVGKSVLLGMISKNTTADVNVIALIGERGREVREFIENDLGEEGLKNSVVIVATSDMSPLIRLRAANVACSVAEYFRNENKNVLLMMDSVTRFAMAAREVSLSAGEPPGQKGYGPSVFARLPKLLERAGTIEGKGSITGIYSVLVEGGDMDEPITDAIRAISDGHIQLSRKLASRNFFPAIDVLSSISRVMNKVVSKEHKIVSSFLRDLMAAYSESEELINVGAYVKGSNPRVDKAIKVIDKINELLRQDLDLGSTLTMEELFTQMIEIAREAEDMGETPLEEGTLEEAV